MRRAVFHAAVLGILVAAGASCSLSWDAPRDGRTEADDGPAVEADGATEAEEGDGSDAEADDVGADADRIEGDVLDGDDDHAGGDADEGADADADADAAADADADADVDAGGEEGTSTCADGWLDPAGALCWENPATDIVGVWEGARAHCDDLAAAGGRPWRLPTIGELRSLVDGCPAMEPGGACGVTDACPSACWTPATCPDCATLAGPGEGGCYWPGAFGSTCGVLWSSTSVPAGTIWGLDFSDSAIYLIDAPCATGACGVRCVRDVGG